MKSIFLSNTTHTKFIEHIKHSLEECSSFLFTVSFVKTSGLALIINDITSALDRGVIGKFIISTYQNFTDIASMNVLLELAKKYTTFECHVDFNDYGEKGFHTKGYIFNFSNYKELIVGSSNITRFALLYNVEWNISISTEETIDSINKAEEEYWIIWDKTRSISSEVINAYALALDYAIEKWDMDFIQSYQGVIPNLMQKKALIEIRRYRDLGVKRAIVIAATGSGKTHLAAFDSRNFDSRSLLFVVHRDTILKEAVDTFRSVYGERRSIGLFQGKTKDIKFDFLFSTNILMAMNLDLFQKDQFDYIVIDEVHHAVASTYRKIINYFEPQFLLGLTATPERMDSESVVDLFERNVPYELRLRDALINNLVVPFKYYGIKDSFVDYSIVESKSLIKQIASDVHCEFIKEKIEMYRPNRKLKALAFCRSIDHARIMSEKMDEIGYPSTYVVGKNDTEERLAAFKNLQDDNHTLQIIFTVDILNEGVDIPAANMVIFLRPTESSTIFIQQLGRGLRKYRNKEYLTVLDFIGNSYTRSVQIAVALGSLSERPSMDKKLIQAYINTDFKTLSLPIVIHFDEQSKEEILNAIEKTNFNSIEFLKTDYLNFKKYLKFDSPLKHIDFINSEYAPDLARLIRKFGSYYAFLSKIEKDYITFKEEEVQFLKYLSSFIPLIRPYEFVIVKNLLNGMLSHDHLFDQYHWNNGFDEKLSNHAIENLKNKYYSQKEQTAKILYLQEEKKFFTLKVDLRNKIFVEHIDDLIQYGLSRYDIDFLNSKEDLKLYGLYSRKQFLIAINSKTMSFREGILWGSESNKLYLFIDLVKDESQKEQLKYLDIFKSSNILQWESQTSTTLTNSKGIKLINHKFADIFVRKYKNEDGISTPYIYIGEGELTKPRESNNSKKSLLFDVMLKHQIPSSLWLDFCIGED